MGFNENPASQQSQNQGFESVNKKKQFQNQGFESVIKKRSSASAYDISDVVNNRVKQASANNGGKNIHLTQTLLNLGPLGTKLSITNSFVDLVEKRLFHAKNTKNVYGTNRNRVHGGVQAKAVIDAGKFKASNFDALSLVIGTWKEVSTREGSLVAKCYFAKKKLVWEILWEKSKSKIEINWSDIAAISASTVANEPGILAVELRTRPAFSQESNLEPRKHSHWQPSQDFTNGQALINRRRDPSRAASVRPVYMCMISFHLSLPLLLPFLSLLNPKIWKRIHYLEFAPGVLDKHYEKLLQFDSRLLELSRIPFPSFDSPLFPSDSYNGITETSLDFNGHGSNIAAGPDSQPVQAYYQIHQPCLSIMNPTVIDFSSALQEVLSRSQLVVNNPGMARMRSQGKVDSAEDLGRDQIQQPFSTGFGEIQVVEDHIQRPFSGETQVMGDQIQQPFPTGFGETQVRGDHIQQPFYRETQEMEYQIQQLFPIGFGETQVMGDHIQQPFSRETQVMEYQIQQPFPTGFGELQVIQQPFPTGFGETQMMGDHIQQPFPTGFGETQVMVYPIQQPFPTGSGETQVMGDHIQQPFSGGTQLMGYHQIQQPFYTGFREIQENPATSFQNYNNVSAPCDDSEGAAGGAILEPQAYNNIMSPWMSNQELPSINNQNNLHRQQ